MDERWESTLLLEDLLSKIDDSVRTYLLHNRLEPLIDSPAKYIASCLRHHLTDVPPSYRHTITRLLLSDHPLAWEQLRRDTRYYKRVPRHLRLCRFCRTALESPEHVLMSCEASDDLSSLRDRFYDSLRAGVSFYSCSSSSSSGRTPFVGVAASYFQPDDNSAHFSFCIQGISIV